MSYFKVVSQHSRGEPEEKHRNFIKDNRLPPEYINLFGTSDAISCVSIIRSDTAQY
jgi:hypothetical protein